MYLGALAPPAAVYRHDHLSDPGWEELMPRGDL
jgi:hypothetical protein